jgi:hypothetical protein
MAKYQHVGAERLGIDAGRDHEGGVGVAALVQADRLKLDLLPGLTCPAHRGFRVKSTVSAAKHKRALVLGAGELVSCHERSRVRLARDPKRRPWGASRL